jgi:hypothetical protein
MSAALLDMAVRVLRDPEAVVGDDPGQLARDAPRLLGLVLAGAATWGLVVGSVRGELQLLYAPLKAPFLWLIPVAVCLPVVRPWFDRDGDKVGTVRLAGAGLVAAARSALLAAAAAPVLWLTLSLHLDYHLAVLVMAASLAFAGLPGLFTVGRALSPGRPRWTVTLASVALLGGVTAQTGWLLRPFIVRPTAEVSFLRPVEANVRSALTATAASSVGVYDGWEARPAGVLGRAMPDRRTNPGEEAAEPAQRDGDDGFATPPEAW